jgi:hypothetical protein
MWSNDVFVRPQGCTRLAVDTEPYTRRGDGEVKFRSPRGYIAQLECGRTPVLKG